MGDEKVLVRGFSAADCKLIDVTVAMSSGEGIALDAVYRQCVLDGSVVESEAFMDVTSDWPNRVQDGNEGSWRTACHLGDDEGGELGYTIEISGFEEAWFAGDAG